MSKRFGRDIVDKGLSGQVSMVGFVQGQEKQKLFHEADVVVAPSHTENFCMVVAEALAAGTPVIASQGTPWKRVEEMGCGLWVSNEPASLTRAIGEISRRPLQEMGARGRQWMQKEFTWKEVGRQMTEALSVPQLAATPWTSGGYVSFLRAAAV